MRGKKKGDIRMADEFGRDDHVVVVGPELESGVAPALRFGDDGISPCTVSHGTGEGIELERCESGSAAGAKVFHRRQSVKHPGPVRVSSIQYRDAWDLLWGSRKGSTEVN